jgi:hypothetical protein
MTNAIGFGWLEFFAPSKRPLWMAPALQEKFDVLALVGSSLLSGLLMQSTLDCWP